MNVVDSKCIGDQTVWNAETMSDTSILLSGFIDSMAQCAQRVFDEHPDAYAAILDESVSNRFLSA